MAAANLPPAFVNFSTPTSGHIVKQYEKLYNYVENLFIVKTRPEFNLRDARKQMLPLGRNKELFKKDGGQYVFAFLYPAEDYKQNNVMKARIVVNDQLTFGMGINIKRFDTFTKMLQLPLFLDQQYLDFGIKASNFAQTQKTIVIERMPAYDTLRRGKIYNTGATFTIADVSDPKGLARRTIEANVAVAKVRFTGSPHVVSFGYGISASVPETAEGGQVGQAPAQAPAAK